MVSVRDIYIYPLNGNLLKLKKCWLATNIDFNICNIHSNLDRWIIIVEQNVRLQGSMHPVKFVSRGRGIMVAGWPLVFQGMLGHSFLISCFTDFFVQIGLSEDEIKIKLGVVYFLFFHQKNWFGRQEKSSRHHFLQQWQFVDKLEIPTLEGLCLANQMTSCTQHAGKERP